MKIVEINSAAELKAAIEQITTTTTDTEAERRAEERLEAVRTIVDAVRERGDAAVSESTAKFDGVELRQEQFELTPGDIERALGQVEPDLVNALRRAHDNIRRFHERNLRQSWEETSPDGTVLGQRVSAIESVGVYVPGGTAFYPSSVLMNIVPARVAGVNEIVMVSPPSHNGTIHPVVVTAAKIAGATRIFRIGGAQAIAALAYGTETFPAILKITGPGNTYVTLAKRLVSSIVDIDKEAGPSEVVVIADETADPRLAAIELLAQAEHDEDSSATLIATSAEVAVGVMGQVPALAASLDRKAIIGRALDAHGAIYVAPGLDAAIDLANALAPEHLALYVGNPKAAFGRIRNAGAVMLGSNTPVAVGDYFAGPNHILPTGRRARFASPLTAEDFRKVSNYISYSPERMRQDAPDIIRLAGAEMLTAHARAVELRQ